IAEQRRTSVAERDHWKAVWPGPVSIEASVTFGVSEDPRVLRTLDDTEPRSIAHVFYAQGLFGDVPQKESARLDKMTEYYIRLLWKRTWLRQDAFTGELTNAEAVGYADRHEHLVQAVKHIWDCLKKVKQFKLCSPGSAAALFYLMGCSASDVGCSGLANKYRDACDETVLDWSHWGKAKTF